VTTEFGEEFAAVDLYNVWGGAHDVDELTDVVVALPGQQLAGALSSGESSTSLRLKLRTLARTVGHWDVLHEAYRISKRARAPKDHYLAYPERPDAFEPRQSTRDAIVDEVYEISGADPKY
jgi:electron-transferring-flavoprotein dehydrogenase